MFVVFKQLRERNGKNRKRARFLELQMLASFDKPHADHGQDQHTGGRNHRHHQRRPGIEHAYIGEKIIDRVESKTNHDAGENLNTYTTRATVHVSKGHR